METTISNFDVNAIAGGTSNESSYIGEVDFATRNETLKAMAMNAGLRLPSTRVPEGDSLLPIGEESKRAMATEVANLPDLAVGLGALRSQIKAEDSRDVVAPIQAVRMSPENGGLFANGKSASKALAYTPNGLNHVLGFIKPSSVKGGMRDTLLALPPTLRSQAFNYFAENTSRSDEVAIRTIVDVRSGRRVVRAVTSEKHSLTNGDDGALIQAIESSVPAGAKLRVTRTLDRTDLEIIWPAMDRQLVVGDIALVSLGIVNSETKGGSLKIEPRLLRVLCYNFTTAYSEGGEEEISLRHVGDLRRKLPEAFRKALRTVEPFVKAFGDAYKNPFPTSLPTRGEVLARVAKANPELPATLWDSVGQLWDRDGALSAGNTLAGLVNGMTRASQELTMAQAQAVEQVAGKAIANGWEALLA